MKKVLIWLSVLLLLLSTVGVSRAIEPEQVLDKEVMQQAQQLYKRCLYSSGRSSFQGLCGLMTSYQLWKLGINKSLEVHDGNDQFDSYKDRKVTTGGHNIKAYSAREYTLLQTLEAITLGGTRDAYNILVGFQWTNTAAGAYYGHACVINAIQDGTVYFTESFDYAMGRMAGQVITCSLEKFAEFFSDWTVYDGAIEFGTKQYANFCQVQGTDLYVQLRFESNLRSQPCLLGQNDCRKLRSLAAGELLRATGVYTNAEGDLFYCIDDRGVTGYVSANAVHRYQWNEECILKQNIQIPQSIAPEEILTLSGRVFSPNAQLKGLELVVADENKDVVLQVQTEVQNSSCELSEFSQALQTPLPQGNYSITLSAQVSYALAQSTAVTQEEVSKVILQQPLAVGTSTPSNETTYSQVIDDGWFLKKNTWYCYKSGAPCTGWITRLGVSYYLQEDGAVTTGWVKEGDTVQYFSATGALCEGWVTTQRGTYWVYDGTVATGLQQIQGKQYCFREDGRLQTRGVVTYEDTVYNIQKDGTAVPEAS